CYYFYFPHENKIVVARYAEFFEKNLITQEVSGRDMDLKEIQDEYTSPSEITSEIPMKVQGNGYPTKGRKIKPKRQNRAREWKEREAKVKVKAEPKLKKYLMGPPVPI
ncbi:hypothetical protein Tco_0354645, partial [Tanacetum coccineum]